MDKNRVEGKVKDIKGRVKRQVGEWTGNDQLQSEGAADQAEGKVENAYGQVKDKVRNIADRVEDKLNDATDGVEDKTKRSA